MTNHSPATNTPDFIVDFILDRTLEPAIQEFGLEHVTIIDPVCGTGTFLVRAFERLFERWREADPLGDARDHVERAMGSIYGFDPDNVDGARRKLIDAMVGKVGSVHYLPTANVAVVAVADALSVSEGFSAVVGSLHTAPLIERYFRLSVAGGFCGLITPSAFMRREFGKILVTDVLPQFDLTSIIDTSGAYIPGFSMPTLMLFGRNRRPVGQLVDVVISRRGEPQMPADSAHGLVWSRIRERADQGHYDDDYITVTQVLRAKLAQHPWNWFC